MADAESTEGAVVDTSVAEISTNEESQETDDIALEDMEISEDEIEETEEAEDSEDVKQDTSPKDTEPAGKEKSEADESEEQSEDKADVEAEQKRRNDEAARKRIAERNARLQQKQVQEAQENVRLEHYLKEAEGDDAELAFRKAEVERLLNQRERVAMNEERLHIGMEKALSSIDLFKTGSPEVKQELADSIDDFIAMYVELNQSGDPVAIHGDITEFLHRKADSIRRIQGVGVRQAAKDKQATKARTMTPPSKTPKTPKVDQDLQDFDDSWK